MRSLAPGGARRERLPAAACLVAMAACLAGCTRAPAPRAILLVTIDTTRADRLSAYGYARPTSPTLDGLARAGVRFEAAHATMPTTDPSHTSMLTGLYPSRHGVLRNGQTVVDANLETLASWLGRRGYATAAVTARAHLDPVAIGLGGFEISDPPEPPALTRTAEQVVARAGARLREIGERDWFLWVHLWEPHAPYDPPAELRERFYSGGLNARGRPPRALRDPPSLLARRRLAPAALRHAGELYDGEIAAADRALARLVDLAVRYAPGASAPLVTVVSDHGESLAERQATTAVGFGHGALLYEEAVRVAWVVWWPGGIPSAVLRSPVSLVDLAPTLSALVDARHAIKAEGRSLARALRSGAEPPTVAPLMIEKRSFSASARVPAKLRARQWARLEGNWKLIYTEDSTHKACEERAGAGRTQLFDLASDPGERRDLAQADGGRCRRMLEALRSWVRAHPRPRGDAASRPVDPRKLENLRALGYVD